MNIATRTLAIERTALRSPAPSRAAAVLRLDEWCRSEGHTVVEGTLELRRNRSIWTGRFEHGWMATCRAIEHGQMYGLGVYRALPDPGWRYFRVLEWDPADRAAAAVRDRP